MAFDGAVFRAALAADRASVETVITASNGVAQVVGRFAADIISAPISRYGAPEFIPPVLPRTSHPTPQMLLASNSLSALLYAQLFSQGLFINTLF